MPKCNTFNLVVREKEPRIICHSRIRTCFEEFPGVHCDKVGGLIACVLKSFSFLSLVCFQLDFSGESKARGKIFKGCCFLSLFSGVLLIQAGSYRIKHIVNKLCFMLHTPNNNQ